VKGLKAGGRSVHQNLKNEETIAGGEVDVKDVVRAGLWCWAMQYSDTLANEDNSFRDHIR
jgi:hypothetical protein